MKFNLPALAKVTPDANARAERTTTPGIHARANSAAASEPTTRAELVASPETAARAEATATPDGEPRFKLPTLIPKPRPLPPYLQAKRAFMERGADCINCPLAKFRPVRTEWFGVGEPAIALVGEAPGKREVQVGRPFVGQSGKLLNFTLDKAGIERRHLAVLNAIACGPIPSENDVIKKAAAERCRPRLLAELRELRPKGIVAVGAYALRVLAPEDTSGVTALRGAKIDLRDDVVEAANAAASESEARAVCETPPDASTRAADEKTPEMAARAVTRTTTNEPTRAESLSTPDPRARALALAKPKVDTRALIEATPIPVARAGNRVTPEVEARATVHASSEAPTRAEASATPDSETRPPWRPLIFTATFHPAHIMRGGDGDSDGPDNESNSSVDLLFYFFLADIGKAWAFVHGQLHEWKVDADLFIDVAGRIHRVFASENGDLTLGSALAPARAEKALYDALKRVYEEAQEHGSLTCDVETDNKDSLEANLTAIGYGTPFGGVCATWNAWTMFPSVRELLYQIHSDRRLRWNWQNGMYDRVVLNRHRVKIREQLFKLKIQGPSEDILLSHHAAFPGLPHKLDQQATQWHVVRPWKNKFRKGSQDPLELVWYCVNDVVMTARIEPMNKRHVVIRKTERVYEADRQLSVIATEMRMFGCYIDRDEQARHRHVQGTRLEYMREALQKDFAAIEEDWRQALARLLADTQRKEDPDSFLARVEMRYKEIAERGTKPTDIGLFKPKAKKDLVALFNVLKIPVKDYTKTGMPKTDKKAMEGAAARHPLMRRLIHLREAQHLIANYVELPIKADGRMHPDWKTTKITGRWGAGRSQNVPNNVAGWPPVQNADGSFKIDKNGDFITPRDNLRSIICAPTAEQVLEIARRDVSLVDPWILARAKKGFGRILVGADEDQVELRIVGFLARDPFLLKIFNEGRDPHAEFARVIFSESFPVFESEIKASGYKPKQTDDVDEEIDKLKAQLGDWSGQHPTSPGHAEAPDDGLDDITRQRLKNVRALLEKLVGVRRAQAMWKRLRDLSKRVEYGGIYKGKAPTLWESIVKDFPEVGLADVEKMLRLIETAMPGVVRWWGECDNYARLNKETREKVLGRARLFPVGNFNPNIAVNFPVQAHNAALIAKGIFRFVALTKPWLLEFDRLYKYNLLDAKWVRARRAEGFDKWKAPNELILNGHDSLVAECDQEDGKKCQKLLTMCLTQEDYDAVHNVRMPYTAEAHVSQRLSRT